MRPESKILADSERFSAPGRRPHCSAGSGADFSTPGTPAKKQDFSAFAKVLTCANSYTVAKLVTLPSF
eukprot:998946-Prymnesium_polylepis.1